MNKDIEIEEIGNYYWCLNIKKEKWKYYWGIEDYDWTEYIEIQKELFELIKKRAEPEKENQLITL